MCDHVSSLASSDQRHSPSYSTQALIHSSRIHGKNWQILLIHTCDFCRHNGEEWGAYLLKAGKLYISCVNWSLSNMCYLWESNYSSYSFTFSSSSIPFLFSSVAILKHCFLLCTLLSSTKCWHLVETTEYSKPNVINDARNLWMS